ncbi:MAG: BatD family protein [Burkholderiales bacterium]
MVKRVLILIFTLLSVLATAQALASLQAKVDRNPVAMDESFNLILQSSDSRSGDPDLSALKQDFDILGQSKSSRFQIDNGQTTQSTQWQIQLMPKRSGKLTIPAIAAGGQSSQPIALQVNPAGQAPASQQDGNLFLEVGAEPHAAYVQQQIIFTVRLYRSVDLGDGSTLSDPTFPNMDAAVERLGADRAFQTVRNGKPYSVIERRYAVFPQKSGQFSSAPVVFDGTVVEAGQGGGLFMFNPFGQSTRHLRLRSKAVTLTVKPIPGAFNGSQWLPASTLQLAEQWSENPPKFTVGEPITRTLTLTAKGQAASQLTALDSQSADGFKLYPDQPALKDSKDDSGITGVRVQKIALIPSRPGSLTLPAVKIKWWNVNSDKMEETSLPARQVTVLPGSPDQTPAAAPPLPAPAPSAQSAGSALGLKLTSLPAAPRGWWPWLSLLLGTGWLATLLLWWRQARKKSPPSPGTAREETQKQAEKQLKKSCLENDPAQAKACLLAWSKQQWPHSPPASLTALARRCDPTLAAALTELDHALYAKTKTHWQGETLWQLFSHHKPKDVEAKTGQDATLPPLYLSP